MSTRSCAIALAMALPISIPSVVFAQGKPAFNPGNLVVSRSVYDNLSTNVSANQQLPPGCTGSNCVTAVANGTYPYVFNNAPVDASFGVTSRIFLDHSTPSGNVINSVEVPNSLDAGITSTSDQLVTSFSSKSELGLNLSTDGRYLTFMGYLAPVNALDASNANTYGAIDPTNPVQETIYRAVAVVDRWGNFNFTLTNAYSGNNGRAAILNNTSGNDVFYTSGNAGNGSNPEPQGIILGAGTQFVPFVAQSEENQTPGTPTPLGNFNITQLGDGADKSGKDDNFRGLTVFNNVVYYTKGSGSNGVNTVYFLDTTGKACPNGTGVPSATATLPTTAPDLSYSASNKALGLTAKNPGLNATNICILNGFSTTLARATSGVIYYPFGLWFADANTLYVADEGDGTVTYDAATNTYTDATPTGGLQKWTFDGTKWNLAYTLQNGLDLGTPYTVAGYPTGPNTGYQGLPWSPATDGLRNITGRVNGDGTVTVWAITSTVSGSGDQGADPNKLVSITDTLSYTGAAQAAHEKFKSLRTAGFGEVLRGVSFGPIN